MDADDDPIALGLALLDREIRRRRIRCPGVEQDCRSRAHQNLTRVLGRLDCSRDPTPFLGKVCHLSVAWELSARRRRLARLPTVPLGDLPPDAGPLARPADLDAVAPADPPTQASRALRPAEWDLLSRLARDHPAASNRQLAAAFHHLTGRRVGHTTAGKGRLLGA